MQKHDQFNLTLADSQATAVTPVKVHNFDIARYEAYAQQLEERCRRFVEAPQGVLVYRRMRVAEVFSYGCSDMRSSLEWQLGALEKSMAFEADVPNFLEPWYGIGTIASAFGFDYLWNPGQAPAVNGRFSSVEKLLEAAFQPVAETPVGRHTIEMTEYFLNATKGRIPMSDCDIQSPLNIAGNVVDINNFFMDMVLNPDGVREAFDRIAALHIDFMKRLQYLIGDALVRPGHGFASAKAFEGMGMSDDNAVMISGDMYTELAVPALVKACDPFGGPVFHSCGNWSDKKHAVLSIPGLKCADGAFSLATDPDANSTEGFAEAFANTGVVLNARIVGKPEVIAQKVRELWRPGMKLIVVTYCETPAEQSEAYRIIHDQVKAMER